jgi:hypothetical protein
VDQGNFILAFSLSHSQGFLMMEPSRESAECQDELKPFFYTQMLKLG